MKDSAGRLVTIARLGRSSKFWVVLAGIVILSFAGLSTRYKTIGGNRLWDRWGHRFCTSTSQGMRCGKAWWEGVEDPPTVSPGQIDSAAYQRRIVAELTPGMTKEDVRQKLGDPRTHVTMDGGLERWTYYNYDNQGQISARTLIIFGSDGKVVEINDM